MITSLLHTKKKIQHKIFIYGHFSPKITFSSLISIRIINHPKHKSICYHPSILPRHRGASAINWTLIEGDKKGGFSIFWADDGLDTGPLLLQKECYIGENDTVDSIYNRYICYIPVTSNRYYFISLPLL